MQTLSAIRQDFLHRNFLAVAPGGHVLYLWVTEVSRQKPPAPVAKRFRRQRHCAQSNIAHCGYLRPLPIGSRQGPCARDGAFADLPKAHSPRALGATSLSWRSTRVIPHAPLRTLGQRRALLGRAIRDPTTKPRQRRAVRLVAAAELMCRMRKCREGQGWP